MHRNGERQDYGRIDLPPAAAGLICEKGFDSDSHVDTGT